MKVIYSHRNPDFEIGCDELQWILWEGKQPSGRWNNTNFFPNISMLLDDLAETMFRREAKKVKELKELDQAVSKVYQLIEKVTGEWSFKGKSATAIDRWQVVNGGKGER